MKTMLKRALLLLPFCLVLALCCPRTLAAAVDPADGASAVSSAGAEWSGAEDASAEGSSAGEMSGLSLLPAEEEPGESSESDGEQSEEQASVPAAPEVTLTHASAAAKTVSLSWSEMENAVSWLVCRSEDSGASWSEPESTEACAWTDDALESGRTYRYRVAGVNAAGTTGAWSETDSISVASAAVTGLKATADSSSQITLTWKASDGAGCYLVYCAEKKNGTYSKLGVVTGTSYTAAELTANSGYYFRVYAAQSTSNQACHSAAASTSRATLLAKTAKLEAKAGRKKVKLKWSKVSGATEYQVCRRLKNGTYSLIATVTGTSYEDKKAKIDTPYVYRVRAVKKSGGKIIRYGEYCRGVSVEVLPLSGYVICVDAGHGNKKTLGKVKLAPNSSKKVSGGSVGTSGVASGVSEASLNLKVAKRLKTALEEKGATVVMTRTSSTTTLNNIDRCKVAKKAGADLTIRLHADGSTNSSVKGVSMQLPSSKYCSKSLVNKSGKAGKAIYKAVVKRTGAKGRGMTKRSDLVGFNWASNPTVLLEMGFLSNRSEDKKLQTTSYQKKIVEGIVNGTVDYFN